MKRPKVRCFERAPVVSEIMIPAHGSAGGRGNSDHSMAASHFLGESGQLETVSEYRVELVCEDSYIRAAIAALKLAHPYEEPAYDVLRMEDL